MVGYGPNKGIIPIACEEIFKKIDASPQQNTEFKVATSMLEIYNEQIQDLLQNPNNRVKGGLRVREDPKKGVFVENLVEEPVKSYEQISGVLDKGNKHRTVAATQMNATSSRAHTVLTISFTQVFYDQETGQPLNRKQSKINLVDLAGSERAAKTGATGDRLQQGSNINKSLSTLGKVITALAKKSSGNWGRNDVIPYRESKLTRILQNALGGNSKTTMIAAISPATYNFDETLSTLRYADQVKSIKNQAIVNETPQEKLIRELKEENEKLKALLEGKPLPSAGAGTNPRTASREANEKREEYERMIEELKRATEEAEKTWSQRLEEQAKTVEVQEVKEEEVKITSPFISNLNEDPQLAGYIKYQIKEGSNLIGKNDGQNPPDIIIQGLGIGVNHCAIVKENDTFILKPSQDEALKTTVNGKILEKDHVLQFNDRIKFGNHNFFIFRHPDQHESSQFDWEYAVKQANQQQVRLLLGAQDQELKKKEQEMKQKLERELEEAQRKIEEQKEKLEFLKKNKDESLNQALVQKEQEILQRKREMQQEYRQKAMEKKSHQQNMMAMQRLKKLLTKSIQQVNQINERAVLLKRNVLFQPQIYRDSRGIGSGLQNTNVRIKVIHPNLSEDIQINWSLQKLDARLTDIQDICNQLSMGVNYSEIDIGYDPFIDDAKSLRSNKQLLGLAYVYLDVIYHMLYIDQDYVPILNDKGQIMGRLKIGLKCVVLGLAIDQYDTLREIIGKNVDLTLEVEEAIQLPDNLCTDVECEYKFPFQDEIFRIEPFEATTTNPKFNFRKLHSINLTQEIVDDIMNYALTLSVYGTISHEKMASELKKLDQNAKRDINQLQTTSYIPLMDISVGEPVGQEEYNSMLYDTSIDLQLAIHEKEQEINEMMIEKQFREQKIQEQLRLLEEKEKQAGIKPPTKNSSACCSLF